MRIVFNRGIPLPALAPRFNKHHNKLAVQKQELQKTDRISKIWGVNFLVQEYHSGAQLFFLVYIVSIDTFLANMFLHVDGETQYDF